MPWLLLTTTALGNFASTLFFKTHKTSQLCWIKFIPQFKLQSCRSFEGKDFGEGWVTKLSHEVSHVAAVECLPRLWSQKPCLDNHPRLLSPASGISICSWAGWECCGLHPPSPEQLEGSMSHFPLGEGLLLKVRSLRDQPKTTWLASSDPSLECKGTVHYIFWSFQITEVYLDQRGRRDWYC